MNVYYLYNQEKGFFVVVVSMGEADKGLCVQQWPSTSFWTKHTPESRTLQTKHDNTAGRHGTGLGACGEGAGQAASGSAGRREGLSQAHTQPSGLRSTGPGAGGATGVRKGMAP